MDCTTRSFIFITRFCNGAHHLYAILKKTSKLVSWEFDKFRVDTHFCKLFSRKTCVAEDRETMQRMLRRIHEYCHECNDIDAQVRRSDTVLFCRYASRCGL